MDTAASIPAGAKDACDALCTVLGVKVPLRLVPQPQTLKPHIVIKRDISKDGEAGEVDPKCARFAFVANKRINVNKGAVLLFGIEHPTPEGTPKSTAPATDSFILEADLLGTADDEVEAPEVGKKVASEVKRARREARKNMVALPPKMRKSLGQKLPNMYYAAAHELGPAPAVPSSALSDAHTSRVFATAAVQTDDLVVPPPPPPPSPPPISISLRAPSCSLDDLRKSPVQLPSPVSADHAREMTPNAHLDLAPLEDEMAFRYELDRSLSPMDLESGSSSLAPSPAGAHAALPEDDSDNVAPAPQVLPEAGPVASAVVGDALPAPAEELGPPLHLGAVTSDDSTSANALLETPPQPLADSGAQARAESPPCPDTPELIVTEISAPMEGVIESVPEVEIKREQIQAAESLSLLDDLPSSYNVPTNNNSDAPPARSAKEIPSEPRAMRSAVSPSTSSSAWAAGRAPPTFVRSTQASSWDAQTATPASHLPVPTPTLYNPLGIRPSASAPVFHRAPPTGPRSLLNAASSSSSASASSNAPAPKRPVVVGAKWSASRGPTQPQPGAPNAILSSSASASSSSLTSMSMSAASSATTLASSASEPASPPTSPAIIAALATSPPTAPKADRDLAVIVGYSSPSPPPARPRPLESGSSGAASLPPPPEIKAAGSSSLLSASPVVEVPAASKWKRIDKAAASGGAAGPISTSEPSPVLPSTSIPAPPPLLPSVQPVSIPLPSASSPTVQPASALTPPVPAQRCASPGRASTSTSASALPSTTSLPPIVSSLPAASLPLATTLQSAASLPPATSSPSTTSMPPHSSAGAPAAPPVVHMRPATIPLPCRPTSIGVIPLAHRPASVLAVPASFRNRRNTPPDAPPAGTSSAQGSRGQAQASAATTGALNVGSEGAADTSRVSAARDLFEPSDAYKAAVAAKVANASNASDPSNALNPSDASNSSNASDPSTTATNASPSNPLKRPHESSVKTVEVKLSSSPAVCSVPLGSVKMEVEMSPTLARASLDHVARSSSVSYATPAPAAGPSLVRPATPITPASFLKTHVPQSASSQMVMDTDFTEGTDTTDNTATTATKKKKRRQKKPYQRWKGLVAGGGQAVAPAMDWPTTVPKLKHRLVPNVSPPPGASAVPGVKRIMVSEDGARIAILCEDHTLRIWLNESADVAPGEIARLNHKQSLVTACWMDMRRILVLTRDGAVLLWTRSMNGKEEWNPLRLFTLPEMGPDDASYCLAYAPDRIAVSVPSGVKIWLYTGGQWKQQRDIIRGGVTAIKFVHDGTGLIGGCRDGVIWYCEVPNGTLRAYAFISQQRRAIESIDIHISGQRMLVTQEGGWAYLISLNANENRGTVEQTYTSDKFHNSPAPMFPGVFAMRGQTVLYGYMHDCVPIWNRKKGGIVYGLKHNKGDVVQAAATFDDPSGVGGSMVTGTSKGELFWWPPPEVHESTSHADTPDDASRKRQRVG